MLKLPCILSIAVLSACASPASGPSVGNIRNAILPGSNEKIPIVELATAPSQAPDPVAFVSRRHGLSGFHSSGAMNNGLQKGDVIEVTILDSGEEGLLSPTETKMLNLGRFTIDQQGFVTLPFVGRQRAAGSSPEALQKRIVEGLRGSAVNPQAVVTVVEKPTSSVTVNGNVRTAGRIPLTSGKERMLDAIALAGGSASAPGSTMVTLVRGSQRASASLDRILAEDRQNVQLLPGDQIFIEGDASSFTALGAFKSTGEFEFEAGKFTLAKAFGRVGGLLDDRADAGNIYLFRSQTGRDIAESVATDNTTTAPASETTPIIYHINLRKVANFANMQAFQMQDGDILYASNARIVNVAKLFTAFQKSPPLPAAPAPKD
ncbi:capsule biosynthesis protein [Phyllobacterium phragmitis]|uniref:Capsule biosynthesis protein n=2 Tax=Phyllobacterium phragmitis TaxID=2670329 RepID=A0A2S9IKT1_9HYPH|nr:capsule biosynthesis protein [Phyllobacterium phragmitis]